MNVTEAEREFAQRLLAGYEVLKLNIPPVTIGEGWAKTTIAPGKEMIVIKDRATSEVVGHGKSLPEACFMAGIRYPDYFAIDDKS